MARRIAATVVLALAVGLTGCFAPPESAPRLVEPTPEPPRPTATSGVTPGVEASPSAPPDQYVVTYLGFGRATVFWSVPGGLVQSRTVDLPHTETVPVVADFHADVMQIPERRSGVGCSVALVSVEQPEGVVLVEYGPIRAQGAASCTVVDETR